ncbi:MAG TPA: RtcB family protein, partial [Planctomycetota bacterium]|nr:RtcB family protein [Planctomycetota bacterium]
MQVNKIGPALFEIAPEGGMRVPARIYATDALMAAIKKDNALQQAANVAHMPGILRYSLAMPDIHWGYGFPIGGVAAFSAENGVISPGGVGYDINCLSGDSRILDALGYTRAIDEIVRDAVRDPVALLDTGSGRIDSAAVIGGFARRPEKPVLSIRTSSGRKIVATADHPFFTADGMREAGTLKVGDRVAALPFEGVAYERPSSEVIVAEADLRRLAERLGKTDSGNGLAQAFARLRSLLPLTYDHPALPVLLKVMGYVLGDGAVYFQRDRLRGRVIANGTPEDLERMAAELGPWVRASRVYSRERRCATATTYGRREFTTTEHAIRIGSTGLALLLAALGIPVGRKAGQDWGVPAWIERAPLWQQRLFLAGFFGAELSSPKVLEQGTCFQCPILCQNRREGHVESGKRFLEQVAGMLARFGVGTHGTSERKEQLNRDGSRSVRLRLVISGRDHDLVSLWGRVGFEYNAKRARKASWAVGYLRAKAAALEERDGLRKRALELRERHGWGAKRILQTIGAGANLRFVERTIYGRPERDVRTAAALQRYEPWREQATAGLGDSGAVWEDIATITPMTGVDVVYDITVDHPAHDFIANGFIVHNCGVRLLRSSVEAASVDRKAMRALVNELYRLVPTGTGHGGVDVEAREFRDEVIVEGARWAVKRGFGHEGDLAHIEEHGRMAGAEPGRVSERALSRGAGEVGSLGSGNHFLEVDVVDEIYLPEAAATLGLELGKLAVIIHTGSRGFGHQICTDQIHVMNGAMKKYGIELPDRQLCCAPIRSPEGEAYLGAMRCAVNFAFASRQVIAAKTREAFRRTLGKSDAEIGLETVYEVAHNIAKMEDHEVSPGLRRTVCVHRKGATRAFPPGHPEIPPEYRKIGQPVLIPGDMGRYSFVLVGADGSMRETWGSTCHGAGRLLSRTAAKKVAPAGGERALEDR